jgi:RNA polymerase sigma-70 factor, ECF subfamily
MNLNEPEGSESCIFKKVKLMEDLSDAELIFRLQQNELQALGILYDRYQLLVFRTTLAITGDPEAANDLLQDVFLRLHRYASHIDRTRPLEPWLYRMSANLAYTWVKRSRRWTRQFEEFFDWLAGGGSNSPYEHVEREDEWRELQKALQALPVQQRVVVVLYYLNDLTLQEISEILEVPTGTVKSRLHYGRNALRKSMGSTDTSAGEILAGLNLNRSESI